MVRLIDKITYLVLLFSSRAILALLAPPRSFRILDHAHPKLSYTGLMQTLPKVTKPAEAQKMRVALSQPTSGRGLVNALQQQQATLLKSKKNAGLVGWANFPLPGGTVLVQRKTGLIVVGLDGKSIPSMARVSHGKAAFPEVDLLKELEAKSEGLRQYMYLDSKGNVTIGVGHLIANETAAETLHNTSLPFSRKDGTGPANNAEVRAEFQKIRALQSLKSGGPKPFDAATSLKINPLNARRLLKSDVLNSLNEVMNSSSYADFETYPAPAQ